VPVVAVVDGVKIAFCANKHPPPHFHTMFAEYRAVVDIASMTVNEGSLPAAKRRKVLMWAAERREVLLARFAAAIAHERVEPVE
jgi:hypothetical protein